MIASVLLIGKKKNRNELIHILLFKDRQKNDNNVLRLRMGMN